MELREQMKLLAAVRVGIGLGLILAPRLSARLWLGREVADQPAVEAAMRGFGARDVALGLGLAIALRREGSPRGWLEAGALADLGDLFGSLAAGRYLPAASRVLTPLGAATAAAAGLKLAAESR